MVGVEFLFLGLNFLVSLVFLFRWLSCPVGVGLVNQLGEILSPTGVVHGCVKSLLKVRFRVVFALVL